ncbi:MAG: alpha-2-macroglobulin family protein [Crocinitomicaceae bacterium]
MKLIISILVIIGFSFSFTAQNIENQFPKSLKVTTVSSPEFLKVEEAKKGGLSRKAIELSQVLLDTAVQRNDIQLFVNCANAIDNQLYRAKYEEKTEEKLIHSLVSKVDRIPQPFQNYLASKSAEWLDDLYNKRALSFDDESLTWVVNKDTFLLKNQDFSELKSALKSMVYQNSALLYQTLIDSGKEIKFNSSEPSSLFEYLAYHHFSKRNWERFKVESDYYFQLAKEITVNSENTDFNLLINCEKAALQSNRWDHYAYWVDRRMQWLKSHVNIESTSDLTFDSLYLLSLKKHSVFLEGHIGVVHVYKRMLDQYKNYAHEYLYSTQKYADSYLKMKEISEKAIAFLNSENLKLKTPERAKFIENELKFFNKCLERIFNKELAISFKIAPEKNKPSLINIEYRNNETAYLKVFKLQNQLQGNYIESFAKMNLKSVYDHSFKFQKDERFLPHELDFITEKNKEYGKYLFIIAENKRLLDSLLKSPSIYNENNFAFYLVQVSDLDVLTTKRMEGIEFLVRDKNSGQPLSNVSVTVFNDKNPTVLKTSKEGKAFYPVNGGRNFEYIVQNKKDRIEGSTYYYNYNSNESEVGNMFLTDRKMYRPGEQVYFKNIVYDNREDKVIASESSRLEITDDNQTVLFEKTYETDEFGAYHDNFSLPNSGFLLGNITVYIDGVWAGNFSVEEFKLPTYKATLDTLKGRVKLGDSLTVSGKAMAYAGYPITNAKVSIEISQQNYFPRWCVVPYESKSVFYTIDTVTDKNGRFEFTFLPTNAKELYGSYFRVDISITDENGETQQLNDHLYVGQQSYRLESQIPEYVVDNEKTKHKVVALNNQSVPEKGLPIKLEVKQINDSEHHLIFLEQPEQKFFEEANFKRYFGKKYSYEKPIKKREVLVTDELKSGDSFLIQDYVKNPGRYTFNFSMIDPNGEKTLLTKEFVFVGTEKKTEQHNEVFWTTLLENKTPETNSGKILIGSNQKKLNIYLEYIYANETIVTSWFKLKKRTTIAVPNFDNQPVKVYIYSIFDGKVYNEEYSFAPSPNQKKLNLQLVTKRDYLEPGSKEEWSLSVTNIDGTPTPNSLLATMYDASLDQLTNNKWSNRFYHHYERVNSWTRETRTNMLTHYSINNFRNDYYDFDNVVLYEDKAFSNQKVGLIDAEEASDVIFEDEAVGKKRPLMRTNFASTAFFYSLTTDSTGKVQLPFTTPDALTTWKFKAFAYTNSLEKGYYEQSFVSSKKIMIQGNTPRYLYQGDSIQFAARVVNNTALKQEAKVTLKWKNEGLETPIEHKIELEGNTSESVFWWVKVPSNFIGMLNYELSASTVEHKDIEVKSIPVLTDKVYLKIAQPIVKTENEVQKFNADKLLELPKSAQVLKLGLQLNPSAAWLALLQIAEQQNQFSNSNNDLLNRLYALIIAKNILKSHPEFKKVIENWSQEGGQNFESELAKDNDLKSLVLEESPWLLDSKNQTHARKAMFQNLNENNLDFEIESKLNQLKSAQLSDGSWSWYGQNKGSIYITQNIISALVDLQLQGLINVNLEITKGLQYLDQYYAKRYSEKSTFNFVNEDMVEWLKARKSMNHSSNKISDEVVTMYWDNVQSNWLNQSLKSKAMIAQLALMNRDYIFAEQIKSSILNQSTIDKSKGMYWNEVNLSRYKAQSQLATIVEIYSLLASFEEMNNNLDLMKLWMMRQSLNSTLTNNATLSKIYQIIAQKGIATDKAIKVKIGSGELETLNATANNEWTWNQKLANKEESKVTIYGDQTVLGSYYLDYLLPMDESIKKGENIRLERHFYIEQGDKEIEVKPGQVIPLGSKLTVKLTIRSEQNLSYVVLKDRKPVGAESRNINSGYYWDGINYYQENKDASCSFFFDYLPKGTHTVEYTYYLTIKGKLRIAPSTIEGVYNPMFKGTSSSEKLVVE